MRFCLSVLMAASLMLLVACGDDDGPDVTGTPTASPASTKETVPPTRTLSPPQPPRELAGINFYTWDSWIAKGLGGCPSQSLEGPFLGPPVFSVSQDDLASIPVQDKQLIRMCKLSGITVLLVPGDNGPVELVAGPAAWPVYVPLDSLTVQDDGTVVAPSRAVDKNTVLAGNMAVRTAPFGLVVAYSSTSIDDAVAAVSGIDVSSVDFPLGKEISTGDVNGIHFESEFSDAASAECFYGAYGFIGGEPEAALSDSRLVIEPPYLPASATPHSNEMYWRCGGLEFAEAGYYLPGGTYPNDQYWIGRKSGTPEWFSGFSEDWYTPTTVAGLPAVLISPPPGLEIDSGCRLFVREAFGITALNGPDPNELMKIAENLNR